MRILIVEDDDNLRAALATELRTAGFDLVEASGGQEAWQRLNDHADLPDVILLDLMMPQMNGQEFRAQQLREPRFAHIPTVVMTARLPTTSLRAQLDTLPVLRKPFALDTLLAALEEVTQPPGRVKRCGCGRSYDEDAWRELHWVAEADNGREVGERLEFRNCACGTTLARERGRHAVSWAPT
jgi:CheY-like chemotaxis protein